MFEVVHILEEKQFVKVDLNCILKTKPFLIVTNIENSHDMKYTRKASMCKRVLKVAKKQYIMIFYTKESIQLYKLNILTTLLDDLKLAPEQ